MGLKSYPTATASELVVADEVIDTVNEIRLAVGNAYVSIESIPGAISQLPFEDNGIDMARLHIKMAIPHIELAIRLMAGIKLQRASGQQVES